MTHEQYNNSTEYVHSVRDRVLMEIGLAFEHGQRAMQEKLSGETVTISQQEYKELLDFKYRYEGLEKWLTTKPKPMKIYGKPLIVF